jgi:hypothetical protein
MENVNGERVKEAMIAANIAFVDHHDCAICGGMVYYVRQGDLLYFDPHCGCGGSGPLEPRSWQDAADWINMQTPEWQATIAKQFGIDLDSALNAEIVG